MDIETRVVPPPPRLRGVLHEAAFVIACLVGSLFLAFVDGRRLVAAAAFAGSVALMLGASALYHRVTWRPRARLWMRRADHAGIYLLIAGTYTPVGLLILHGGVQRVVLGIVWGGAAAAILTKLFWVAAPKWLSVALAITLGWVGIAALPQITRVAGPAAVALLGAGRPRVHGRRHRLRSPQAGPRPRGLRLPRGVPRAHPRRVGVSVRRDRLLRRPGGLMQGTMLWFNVEKGYGYIETEQEERLYVTRTGFLPDHEPAARCKGRPVLFERELVDGEACAVSVSFVIQPDPRRARLRHSRGGKSV